jgi:hypothetical protein
VRAFAALDSPEFHLKRRGIAHTGYAPEVLRRKDRGWSHPRVLGLNAYCPGRKGFNRRRSAEYAMSQSYDCGRQHTLPTKNMISSGVTVAHVTSGRMHVIKDGVDALSAAPFD